MTKGTPKAGKGLEILQKLGEKEHPDRSSRTLSLNTFAYLSLINLCEAKGLTASRVIDELITNFLDEVDSGWKSKNIKELQKVKK